MLNLIRFKPYATYPDGHELAGKGLTGAEAYKEYMRTIQPVLERSGGHIVWAGGFEAMVAGPADWECEQTFVMAYPMPPRSWAWSRTRTTHRSWCTGRQLCWIRGLSASVQKQVLAPAYPDRLAHSKPGIR